MRTNKAAHNYNVDLDFSFVPAVPHFLFSFMWLGCSAASNIWQPCNEQLPIAAILHRGFEKSRDRVRICSCQAISYYIDSFFRPGFPHQHSAEVSKHHIGHTGRAQHKGADLPIVITLKNRGCELIWPALAKKRNKLP